jgi:hypothetical protein
MMGEQRPRNGRRAQQSRSWHPARTQFEHVYEHKINSGYLSEDCSLRRPLRHSHEI